MLIVEVAPGDADPAGLSECQATAQQGQPAAAMGTYLIWIAGGYALGGCARQVLHMRASDLVGPITESGRKPL